MESEFGRISLLLNGSSNEEKVAGLLLSVKLLEMEKLTSVESKMLLDNAYAVIGPDFIIKLMWNIDKRRLFRQASISFMAFSIQNGLSHLFKDFTLRLIDLLFSSVRLTSKISPNLDTSPSPSTSDQKYDRQFALDLLTTIKWITAEGERSAIQAILIHLLSYAGKVTTELPGYFYPLLLDYAMDLSNMIYSSSNFSGNYKDSGIMSTDTAEKLRILIVKGFHGGALEAVRDSSLQCCLHFLSSNCAFNPTWSLDGMKDIDDAVVKKTQTKIITEKLNQDVSSAACGTFPKLLVSIISIEVHLLLEEALALFKEPQGEPQIHSYSDLRDPSVDRRKKYDEVKLDSNSDYTLLRIERLSKMIPCCMSLLNTIILLLVGREEGEGITVEAHWSILSSPAILHIRQTVHNIFQKVFDFLKEISDISQETMNNIYNSNHNTSNDKNNVMVDRSNRNDTLLLTIVRQVTVALCLWVLEDEDMRDSFVLNIPLILVWSVVPMYFNDNSDGDDVANKVSDGVDQGNKYWTTSSMIVWKALSHPLVTAQSQGEVEAGEDIGDILHYLLPCLAAISGGMTAEDELADRLCAIDGGLLLCRLVNLSLLIGQNATHLRREDQKLNEVESSEGSSQKKQEVRERGRDDSKSASFVRLCHTCSSACDQLTFLFQWKQKEIILLRKGESETEALSALFCLTKDTFPYIPKVAPYSLSKSKRSQEDRHAERLSNILAVASGTLSGSLIESTDSKATTTTALYFLDCAVSNLVTILSLISID